MNKKEITSARVLRPTLDRLEEVKAYPRETIDDQLNRLVNFYLEHGGKKLKDVMQTEGKGIE